MTNMYSRITGLVAVLLLLGVGAGTSAEAQVIPNFGQFHVGRVGGGSDEGTAQGTVTNPTNRAMFYLGILYWPDGTLDTSWGGGGCAGGILPPHGGLALPAPGNNERCDSGTDDVDCTDARRKTLEVIAVPSGNSDPLRGIFGGNRKVGVKLHARKSGLGKSVDPQHFHLPTGQIKTQLIACACNQMNISNITNDVMNEVGIFCP